MSVVGVGVDLVEVARIERSRVDERRNRVLPVDEISGEAFAARFAAKEAVSKAFGTGIGHSMGWRDIDVHREGTGQPLAVLDAGAKQLAASMRSWNPTSSVIRAAGASCAKSPAPATREKSASK